MKAFFDRTSKPHTFKVNSLVWLKDEGTTVPRRLQLLWRGPYLIERFLTDYYTVILRDLNTGARLKNKIHVQRLNPYVPELTKIQQENFDKDYVKIDDVLAKQEPAYSYTELRDQGSQTDPTGDSLQGAKILTRVAIQPTPVALSKQEGDGTSTTVQHGYNLRNRVLA